MDMAEFDAMDETVDTKADIFKALSSASGKILAKVILPAKLECLSEMIKPIKKCAQKQGFSPNRINEIELALEEALVNIISYAYPDPNAVGNAEIWCWLNDKALFIIEIKDSGIPFDSLQKDNPELIDNIADRAVGGLGIFLIKQFMDDVKYRREQNYNILSFTVVKRDSTKPFYGRSEC